MGRAVRERQRGACVFDCAVASQAQRKGSTLNRTRLNRTSPIQPVRAAVVRLTVHQKPGHTS